MTRPPHSELVNFHADYRRDTNFSAFARLLQSKWREKRGYPRRSQDGKYWYGNYLEIHFARENKVNFLTQNIRELVTIELIRIRKAGGLAQEDRIWGNLLSSQPLCFNLFGELAVDRDLATSYVNRLFPFKIDTVTAVKFEYSPGRGDPKYIGDRSAFDVFIEYSKNEKRGFIGIEVKYAESLREETKAIAAKNYKKPYMDLTIECGLFNHGCISQLKEPPVSQIWRDHLLSIATKPDYDEGCFVFLFPKGNIQCQHGVDQYRRYLGDDEAEKTGFYPRYLEDFVETLVELTHAPWAIDLKERYLGTHD